MHLVSRQRHGWIREELLGCEDVQGEGGGGILCQLVIREWVCMGALAVEFFFGKLRGAGRGAMRLPIFFALLALLGGRHIAVRRNQRRVWGGESVVH